jgi:non-ribosomal peptide synthetase component F
MSSGGSLSKGSKYLLPLSTPVVVALQALIKKSDFSPSVILEGASAVLLHRYTGEDDVVFGVCREHEVAGEWICGATPLRVRLSGAMTIAEGLQAAKASAPSRDFEAATLDQNADWNHLSGGVLLFNNSCEGLLSRDFPSDGAPLQITLSTDLGWTLEAKYDPDSPDARTIAQIVGHLGVVLEAIAADPLQLISTLPLQGPTERRQSNAECSSAPAAYPEQCAHELFEEQVVRTPEAIAVSFEAKRITYRELNDMADVVARHLREMGVGPEVIVAICMERSIAMVAGVLGILKAGGAYLPLDPLYPVERLVFMLEDSLRPPGLSRQ